MKTFYFMLTKEKNSWPMKHISSHQACFFKNISYKVAMDLKQNSGRINGLATMLLKTLIPDYS